jgi:hypothetical protein
VRVGLTAPIGFVYYKTGPNVPQVMCFRNRHSPRVQSRCFREFKTNLALMERNTHQALLDAGESKQP